MQLPVRPFQTNTHVMVHLLPRSDRQQFALDAGSLTFRLRMAKPVPSNRDQITILLLRMTKLIRGNRIQVAVFIIEKRIVCKLESVRLLPRDLSSSQILRRHVGRAALRPSIAFLSEDKPWRLPERLRDRGHRLLPRL